MQEVCGRLGWVELDRPISPKRGSILTVVVCSCGLRSHVIWQRGCAVVLSAGSHDILQGVNHVFLGFLPWRGMNLLPACLR